MTVWSTIEGMADLMTTGAELVQALAAASLLILGSEAFKKMPEFGYRN